MMPRPGMISTAARRRCAAVRGTEEMFTGLTPSTMVNIRNPGMLLARLASLSRMLLMPNRWTRGRSVRSRTVNGAPWLTAAAAALLHDVRDLVRHQRQVVGARARPQEHVGAVRDRARAQRHRHLTRRA